MNTKLLMTLSAIVMGIVGMLLSFLPQEVSDYINQAGTSAIILQILGALYVGFAMINWTAKANLIGGIYGRPIAIGNFTHFTIGALALVKIASADTKQIPILLITIAYSIFAVAFGYVFFTHPGSKSQSL